MVGIIRLFDCVKCDGHIWQTRMITAKRQPGSESYCLMMLRIVLKNTLSYFF